ncbi:MAG: hypothetical protein COA58_04105 [Bacteroidetes bacterium]|nr:MAG: hypothetical protein COA58_04105 [Bacteroidota bacterium]
MRIFLILSVTIASLLSGCHRSDVFYSDDTKVIGHGGMGITHDFPLNTFEAIAFALHKGTDGVEIDVQMTEDSVLIAYHHKMLEETMDEDGAIHNQIWKKIRNAEYSELLYSEYGLVSLDDIFRNLVEFKDKRYFFDLKMFSPDTSDLYYAKFTRQVFQIIDGYGLEHVTLEVKNLRLAKYIQEIRPNQSIFIYQDFDTALDLCIENDFQGITIDIDQISLAHVELAHVNGIKVACINTHSKDRNDMAFKIGVDYNQTDMVNYVMRQKRR